MKIHTAFIVLHGLLATFYVNSVPVAVQPEVVKQTLAPRQSSPDSEDVYTDLTDVPSGLLVSGVSLLGVHRGLEYSGFYYGRSPAVSLFPVSGYTAGALGRLAINRNLKLGSAYPGSDVRFFDLHSLAFYCVTASVLAPPAALKCTLSFTPVYAGGRNGDTQFATFTPVPGSDVFVPGVTPQTPIQPVNFGPQFQNVTGVIFKYENGFLTTIVPVPVPAEAAHFAATNFHYTLYR